jgi:hypothetical protein
MFSSENQWKWKVKEANNVRRKEKKTCSDGLRLFDICGNGKSGENMDTDLGPGVRWNWKNTCSGCDNSVPCFWRELLDKTRTNSVKDANFWLNDTPLGKNEPKKRGAR